MNKIKEKIILIIFIIGLSLSNILFSEAMNEEYKQYPYHIKNMHVDVEVNEKREYIIKEYIDVYFNEGRRGIIRNIPLKSSLEKAKIKDINVNGDMFSINKKSSYVDIKIGNPDIIIYGEKKYIIEYTLENHNDKDNYGDYIYLNVLGDDWDVPVLNFTATIKYPDTFSHRKITLTSGEYGSTSNYYADYMVNSNIINIKSSTVIPSFNAVTINIEFEEGVFNNVPVKIDTSLNDMLTIILGVVTIFLIFKSRSNVKAIPKVVEFYPPEDMSSVNLGYIYSGVVTSTMITSYIYSWASKGYLKIDMSPDNKITLIKKMNVESNDKFEKDLFDKIFYCGCGNPKKVTESQLEYKLSEAFKIVKTKVKEKYKKDKRYNKQLSPYAKRIRYLCGILIILNVISLAKQNYCVSETYFVILIFGVGLIITLISFIQEISYDFNSSFIKNIKSYYDLTSVNINIIAFYIVLYFMVLSSSLLDLILSTMPLFIIMIMTAMIIPDKSEYEKEIYGRIAGFKDFIEKAEKDKLEMLMSLDSEYFYNILPYAQVLGVTNVWIDKFKDIAINPSENYGNRSSSITDMSVSLNKVIRSADKTKSNNSSESGYSGGGYSGGGSGGGGGRSW